MSEDDNKILSFQPKPVEPDRIKSVLDVAASGLGLQKLVIIGVTHEGGINMYPSGFTSPVEIAGILEAGKFSALAGGRK
jgi:hypothetical protein